jgi:hypothetical protein
MACARMAWRHEEGDLTERPPGTLRRNQPQGAHRLVQKQPIPGRPVPRRQSAPERPRAGQSRPSYLPGGKRPEYHSAAVPKVTAKTHIGD